MGTPTAQAQSTRPNHYLPAAGIALSLLTLALAILWVSQQLRRELQSQIAHRDAEALAAVVMAQVTNPDPEIDTPSLEDPAGQLQAVLNASRLRGVIAVRLFDPQGQFQSAFPLAVTDATLSPTDLSHLAATGKLGRLHPRAQPADLFWSRPSNPARPPPQSPLLEVLLALPPNPESPALGIAQFFLDGRSIAAEFQQLDRHLLHHGLAVFALGGAVAVTGLVLAFRQLQHTQRLLLQRSSDLATANRELTLAAKTSAVGALTSQLVHGLKSPLFGLQSFLEARREDAPHDDPDWQVATRTARQMQTLIADIVRILNESGGITQYEITLADFAQLLRHRLQPVFVSSDITLQIAHLTQAVLANHVANLVLLIAENLVHNALQASPRGGRVDVRFLPTPSGLTLSVRDQGGGVPEAIRARLFTPGPSTKPNGSGIGLAICKQLALHLGATLSLRESSPQGSEFTLELPHSLLHPPPQPPRS